MVGIQHHSARFVHDGVHVLGFLVLRVNVEYGEFIVVSRLHALKGDLNGAGGLDLLSVVEQGDIQQECLFGVLARLFHRLLPEGNDVLVGDRLDREGDLLNRIGQGLRIAGDGDGNAVLALGGQDELLRRLLVFRLLLRQLAVAEDGGIVQLIGDVLHLIRGVALDGLELDGVLVLVVHDLHHQTHVIGSGRLVLNVKVEEDQVAGLRQVLVRRAVEVVLLLGEGLDPMLTVGVQRDTLHLGVVQDEGGKHGAPVAVGVAVPCAVAGIALDGLAVLQHNVILCALLIAQLSLGNGNDVLPPVAGQLHILYGALPDLRSLHIGGGVGVAGKGVGMLLQSADGGVGDRGGNLALFQIAGQNQLALGLLLTAGEHLLPGVALIGMLVAVALLQTAGQLTGGLGVASVGVVVTLALLLTADQLAPLEGVAVVGVGVASHQLVAALVVDMRLRDHYVAALVMDVLRDAALCVLFHCNGRQNQRIGRAKHHHCRQTADGLVPTPFALVRLRVFRCLLQRILFHLSITLLIIPAFQVRTGARPEKQSFPQFVPQTHSLPLCLWSLPT